MLMRKRYYTSRALAAIADLLHARARLCIRPRHGAVERLQVMFAVTHSSMMMLLSIAAVAILLCATSFEVQAQSDSGSVQALSNTGSYRLKTYPIAT